MPLPAGFNARPSSGVRSIRFYVTGTTTANFPDNAFTFVNGTGANPFTPLPVVPPGSTAPVDITPNPWGTGTGTSNPDPAAPTVAPIHTIWSRAIIVHNTGASDLVVSFDGTNTHGLVKANTAEHYYDRYESGIAVKGSGGTGTFTIEAW